MITREILCQLAYLAKAMPKCGKHKTRIVIDILKQLIETGEFSVEEKNGKCMLRHEISGNQYTVHIDQKAYHPLKRFVRNDCGCDQIHFLN